jgi:hypothetical protein
MSEKWYYSTGSEKIGPVDHLQIGTLISSGQLNLKDLVWKKGMANWDKIENIPDFIEFINNQLDENLPPPLPANQDSPNANKDKNIVSSDKVTVEVNVEGVLGGYGCLNIFVDEEFIGGCARYIDGVHGETFQTTIGHRSIKLVHQIEQKDLPPTLASKSVLGNVLSMQELHLANLNKEKIYRLYIERGGHYTVKFSTMPEFLGKEKIGNMFSSVIKGLASGLTLLPSSFSINRVEDAKEKLDPSLYFKKMAVGLWENLNDKNLSILITNDGAFMRADGLMAKYNWEEKYKINVFDINNNEKFEFQVTSLSQKQLILSHNGQSLHLIKGKTLTELEMEREKEIFLRQAHIKSEIFKNYALGVSSLILNSGLSVLSAGAGVGAAVAGTGIGIGAAVAGTGIGIGAAAIGIAAASSSESSSNNSLSNPPTSSSSNSNLISQKTSSASLPPPAMREKQAVALSGAVIVNYDGSGGMSFQNKCDACGRITTGTITMSVPSRGSFKSSGSFNCDNCKHRNAVKFQGI